MHKPEHRGIGHCGSFHHVLEWQLFAQMGKHFHNIACGQDSLRLIAVFPVTTFGIAQPRRVVGSLGTNARFMEAHFDVQSVKHIPTNGMAKAGSVAGARGAAPKVRNVELTSMAGRLNGSAKGSG